MRNTIRIRYWDSMKNRALYHPTILHYTSKCAFICFTFHWMNPMGGYSAKKVNACKSFSIDYSRIYVTLHNSVFSLCVCGIIDIRH